MRVARYWGSVDIVRPCPDFEQPFRHRVWGGSDVSQAEADAEAERRAAEMRSRPIPAHRDRTPHDSYGTYPDCSRPEPLIEDVLDGEGRRAGAVTLNGYGAEVLNTASLGFVDIDLPETGAIGRGLRRLLKKQPPEEAAAERVTGWAQAAPGRSARVYRTAAGLRVLIVSPGLDPASPVTASLMRELDADPRYAELCRLQKSFRARLTPKPWRIGLDRPKVRYDAYAGGERWLTEWIAAYRAASEGYAVCRLVAVTGASATADREAASLVDLHDAMTRVGKDLPLA